VIATKGKSYWMRKRGATEENRIEDDGAALPKAARKA
jgi:hypothetical protein